MRLAGSAKRSTVRPSSAYSPGAFPSAESRSVWHDGHCGRSSPPVAMAVLFAAPDSPLMALSSLTGVTRRWPSSRNTSMQRRDGHRPARSQTPSTRRIGNNSENRLTLVLVGDPELRHAHEHGVAGRACPARRRARKRPRSSARRVWTLLAHRLKLAGCELPLFEGSSPFIAPAQGAHSY
jgi:hypothetical protein